MPDMDGEVKIKIGSTIDTKQAVQELKNLKNTIKQSTNFRDVEIKGLKFDYKDVKQSIMGLRNEIDKILSAPNAGKSSAILKLESQLKTTIQQSIKLDSELRKLYVAKIPTQAFVDVSNDLQKAVDHAQKLGEKLEAVKGQTDIKLTPLQERLEQLQAGAQKYKQILDSNMYNGKELRGGDRSMFQSLYAGYSEEIQKIQQEMAQIRKSSGLTDLQAEWEKSTQAVKSYEAELAQLKQGGFAYTQGSDTQEYADKASQLDNIKDKLNILVAKYYEMTRASSGQTTPLKKVHTTFQGILGTVVKTGVNLGTYLVGGVNKLATAVKKLGKTTQSTNMLSQMSFKKLFKQVLKYGFGIRSTFILFRKLKATVKEDFKVMGEDIPAFGAKIEGLKSSFDLLKHSLGSAFEPIASIAIPLLTKLMDYLSTLFDMLGQISAAIFGQTTYAKALKKTTAETKKATDAAKGYLSPIDTIHQYTKDKGSGDSSGGTSGWYEEAQVSDKAQQIAQSFKNFITGIQEAIKPFTDALSRLWNEGLAKFANFAWTGLKDFYNNFLVPIGKWAFGEDTGLTRLVNVINEFLNSIDWDELNRALADFWTAIEPYAEQFGEGLIDFFEDVLGFLKENVIDNLPGLLDSITKVLNDGDPSTARKWGYALGVVALGLFAFNIVSGVVGFFMPILTFLGGLIKLLGAPILATGGKLLSGLGTSIGGAFTKAFATSSVLTGAGGLTSFLFTDIGALSAAGVSAGTLIATGVIGGLIAAWGGWNFGQWLYEKITGDDTDYGSFGDQLGQIITSITEGDAGPALKEWWGEIWGGLVAFFTDVWNGLVLFFSETWNTIAGQLSAVVEFIANIFTVCWDAIVAVWNVAVDFFGSIWDGIKQIFSVVGNFFKGIFEGAWFTVKTIWGVVVDFFKGIWNGISTAFSVVGDFFKGVFEGAWNGIKSIWNGVTGFFQGLWNGIKDIFSNVAGFFKGVFEGASQVVSNIIDTMVGIIKAPINFIIDGINAFIGGLNMIQVPDWVPAIGGKGINIPEIPRLAQGAVIPPNKQFLAVLGDQKNGTNIEAPLETIKQAVREAIGTNKGSETVTVNLTLDRRILAQAVVAEGKVIKATSNQNIFNF